MTCQARIEEAKKEPLLLLCGCASMGHHRLLHHEVTGRPKESRGRPTTKSSSELNISIKCYSYYHPKWKEARINLGVVRLWSKAIVHRQDLGRQVKRSR